MRPRPPYGHVGWGGVPNTKLPVRVINAIGSPCRDPKARWAHRRGSATANDLCKRHMLGYSGEGVLVTARVEDGAQVAR